MRKQMLTVSQIRSQIKWGTTIYLSCRQFTCSDGYRLSVVKQDEITTKEQMDKKLIQLVKEYMSA